MIARPKSEPVKDSCDLSSRISILNIYIVANAFRYEFDGLSGGGDGGVWCPARFIHASTVYGMSQIYEKIIRVASR